MNWEGLTTENHLAAIYKKDRLDEQMSIPEIREMYGSDLYGPNQNRKMSNCIDDMKAYQYHQNIMQHKMELALQKDRERNANKAPFGSGLGIMAQIEQSNVLPYTSMTIDEITAFLNEMTKSIEKEEKQMDNMVLRTGEWGSKEFERALHREIRKDLSVEEWTKILEKEMTL